MIKGRDNVTKVFDTEPYLDNIRRVTLADFIGPDPAHPAYEKHREPLVITDFFDALGWKKMSGLDELVNACGEETLDLNVNYTSDERFATRANEVARTTTVKEAVDAMQREPGRWIISEQPLPDSLYSVFPTPEVFEHDDLLRTLFVAEGGNYAVMHIDEDFRHVLLPMASGHKRVCLISPMKLQEVRPSQDSRYSNSSTLCLENFSREEKVEFLRSVDALEAVIGPGESIYFPPLTFHYIEYVDTSISMNLRLRRTREQVFLCELIDYLWPRQEHLLHGLASVVLDPATPNRKELFDRLAEGFRTAFVGASEEIRAFGELLMSMHEELCPGRLKPIKHLEAKAYGLVPESFVPNPHLAWMSRLDEVGPLESSERLMLGPGFSILREAGDNGLALVAEGELLTTVEADSESELVLQLALLDELGQNQHRSPLTLGEIAERISQSPDRVCLAAAHLRVLGWIREAQSLPEWIAELYE